MKKRGYIFWGIILLILISLHYDNQIIRGVSELRNSFLDNLFSWITFIGSKEVIFLFFTGLFLLYKKNRKLVLPLWFTFFASAVIGFIIKFLIQRPRPFQQGIVSITTVLEQANYLTWNFSFPSSHTLFAFCVLPLLSKAFPRLKKLWIIVAVLIGFSRIYLGVHFLSDVLAGGIIGYFIGLWIIRLEKERKWCENIWKRIFKN